jgi:carboxylesterase family protein
MPGGAAAASGAPRLRGRRARPPRRLPHGRRGDARRQAWPRSCCRRRVPDWTSARRARSSPCARSWTPSRRRDARRNAPARRARRRPADPPAHPAANQRGTRMPTITPGTSPKVAGTPAKRATSPWRKPDRSGKGAPHHRRGAAVFRGIPFAEPAVDDLRFAAPTSARSWDGVREELVFGPPPPQAGEFGRNELTGRGDWLTVNVWSPDPSRDAGLPGNSVDSRRRLYDSACPAR